MSKRHVLRSFAGWLALAMLLGSYPVLDSGIALAAKSEDAKSQPQAMSVVNVNQATADQLQTVRGIGPALAERILKYRTEHGRFERIDDLVQIPGIGEAKLQKIKSQVTV